MQRGRGLRGDLDWDDSVLDIGCRRQVHQFIDRVPATPAMLHFGAEDPMIPLSDVEEVAAAHPGVAVHVYEGADHGFNCDARASYHPASAELAQQRTLDFLRTHGGCLTGPPFILEVYL